MLQTYLDSNVVWGVKDDGRVYFRNGLEAGWVRVPDDEEQQSTFKQIVIGKLGVFGIDKEGHLYYRVGTRNSARSIGQYWQKYDHFIYAVFSIGSGFWTNLAF